MTDDPPFRLKLVPLLVTAALGFALPIAAAYAAVLSSHYFHTPSPKGPTLPWLYIHHAFQLAFALIAILVVKRFVPADYGLHAPREKSYVGAAILWGIFFGVLMTVVDYAPQLIALTKPTLAYPLTRANVTGWLFFEGVYVGPTEEIPFRALLVTYLAATMPGKLRLGRFTMNWAGIIADFRAAARGQLRHPRLATRAGPADLCLCARRALCVLAREIEKHRSPNHRPQCRRRGGICDPVRLGGARLRARTRRIQRS
jgi:hypothetical protein